VASWERSQHPPPEGGKSRERGEKSKKAPRGWNKGQNASGGKRFLGKDTVSKSRGASYGVLWGIGEGNAHVLLWGLSGPDFKDDPSCQESKFEESLGGERGRTVG